MKKLVTAVFLLIGMGVIAQEDTKAKGDLPDISPEEAATLKTKRMTLDLNLNDSQIDEVYQMNLKNARERQAKRAEMKQKRQSGDLTKPTKEERMSLMNDRLDKQIDHKRNMQRVLNQEQFQKWERGAKRAQQKRKGAQMKGQHGMRGKQKGMRGQRGMKRQRIKR